MCTWIGAQAQIDTSRTGGKNPLVESAMKISFMGEQLDDMEDVERGPQTGYVTHEEGQALMARKGRTADTIEVDEEGNVVGVTAGDTGSPLPGGATEPETGSYEAFLQMFGGGGSPPPDRQ